MIAPGVIMGANSRLPVTAGSGTTPAYINQGVGIMANGSVAIDTDAPAGNRIGAGFKLSPAGAIYGTVTPNSDDVIMGGLRITQTGAVVYESAAATLVINGNGITANGRLAVV